jgi:phenylalanyl-tRNA synthetase beta chain
MELDLSRIMEASPRVRPAPVFSRHPVAKEDLALVVADDVPVAVIEEAVRTGAGDLLEDITLFDVYRGDQIPDGQKSVAFALRFRASDRTLDADEIARARQGAIDAAAGVGARLR